MGAEISRRSHRPPKVSLVDKATWTGEPVELVDKENQCVLDVFLKLTSDEEQTNLDYQPQKRPHSETCLRQYNQPLEPLIGKVDLSCCDWLHRTDLGLALPIRMEQTRQGMSGGSTPEISSLNGTGGAAMEGDETEEVSLGSFADTGPPDRICKLQVDALSQTESTSAVSASARLGVLFDADEDDARGMSHKATSIPKLQAVIAERSSRLMHKSRRPV
ncbi:unnamed protein product [Mesocestoides corti]|uniref:Uncharacterized protein n=1 Tax=Mesocestoides corti TaxID=53468 RepID=A0A0R3UMA3_MESCO|nr:unnamed protein product [Mesocestoides corti]